MYERNNEKYNTLLVVLKRKNKNMTISKKAKDSITENVKVRAAFMYEFEMSEKSVQNWVKKDSIKLTTPKAVQIIKKETGLTEKQILA